MDMRLKPVSKVLMAVALLAFVGCSSSAEKETANQLISKVSEQFAPDSRVALFEVEAASSNGELVLNGETTLPKAKTALKDSLAARNIQAVDSISVLPEQELGDQVYGIVNNSVANIRSEPSHPAQLATQATLGMPLKVLKKNSNWYLVQTPDDYLSWVDSGGLEVMNQQEYEEWKKADKVIYLNTYGYAYTQPDEKAAKVSDLVSGSILKRVSTEGGFYEVEYPDGRTGYVSQREARSFESWKKSVEMEENELVQTAKKLTGAPYLWGGTSTKGMDCSGFTKTIYFLNGWIIPRDASQQVKAGEPIDTSEGFDNLRPGDLLFFGRPATEDSPQRVVHVGMWIGNNEFIHSSGRVRVSSVDPEADNYDESNVNRFLEAKRFVQHKQGNIIDVAEMYNI